MSEVQVFICAGKCGKDTPVDENGGCSWKRLEVLGRYRCWDCERLLTRMSSIEGSPPRLEHDTLKSNDIGALKKLPEPRKLHEIPR